MKYLAILFALCAMITQPLMAQKSHPMAGDWKGSIDIQGQKLPIKTEFSKDDNSYTGNIHLQGVMLPLQKIHVGQQDSVRFQFTTNVNTARFQGTFKNDSTISGLYYQAGKTFTFKLKRYEPQAKEQNLSDKTSAEPSKNVHNPVLAGRWKGHFSDSSSFKTYFQHSEKKYKGFITIQSQRVPLSQIYTTKDDSVFFYFAPNGGAHFKGFFQNDSLITGDYYQNGGHLRFKLNRDKSNPDAYKPEKPKPYHHKDLIIKNDSIKIGGTLTWPERETSDQLVIMTTGSGAENRDERIYGFKVFAQIADYLTRHGIATFRYDDRGVGESTGNLGNATLPMLASDVSSIVDYFSNTSDHPFNTIVLLGHSEGGEIDGMAAAKDSLVDKLILMASPGISIKRVVRYQVRNSYKSRNVPDKMIDDEIASREELMSAIRNDENVTAAKEKFRARFGRVIRTLPAVAQQDSSEVNNYITQKVNDLVKIYSYPKLQSQLFHDPATNLKKLHIPVLALFGGKDTQVLISKNRPPIQAALDSAGVSYQINIFKNANHPFQNAKTGSVQEYATLKKQFVKSFLPTIEQWLKQASER